MFGLIGLLQNVTTSEDCALTLLHISQINMGHTRSESVTVFTICCKVAASKGGRSPSSALPNCPLASATSFSQQQLTTETKSLSLQIIYSSLTGPDYNIFARTSQKTPFLCCCGVVAFVPVWVPTWSLLIHCQTMTVVFRATALV
jgi:hypothetical protein